jgi:predicted GH43/DUF377 family glycosyl hydrolase
MTQIPIWALIVIGIGGSFITGGFALAIHWISKRSEERKQQNSLFITAAIENWKKGVDYALSQNKKTLIFPLDSFIINMLTLSDVLQKEKLTKENIIQKLKEVDGINNEVLKYMEEKQAKEKEKKDIGSKTPEN